MKKTLLALVVAATATTANAAEVFKSEDASVNFYGQLRQELKFADKYDHEPTLSSGSSRMGIDGSYSVNDDFAINGLVEVSVDEKSDSMYVRQHLVSFDTASAGSFQFGKTWILADTVYFADYSYFWGGATSSAYSAVGGYSHDSQVVYSFDTDAFWVKAGYGITDADSENELVELFAGTSFGDLSVHVGGGVNENVENTLENTYFEGTVEYAIANGVIGFTYYNSSIDINVPTLAIDKIDQNFFALAGSFGVADKTTVYGGVEYADQEAGNLEEDSFVAYLGTEYKFSSWARVYAEYGYADGSTLGYENDNVVVDPTTADGAHNFGIGARFYW